MLNHLTPYQTFTIAMDLVCEGCRKRLEVYPTSLGWKHEGADYDAYAFCRAIQIRNIRDTCTTEIVRL